jgi:secreted trypsin-like serine protease
MVSTVTFYTNSRNRADVGQGYDGVVRLVANGFYGTGVLLYDGRAVLTAAHVVKNSTAGDVTVYFETSAGNQLMAANRVTLFPSYDPVNSNDDLALVWLSGSAPVAAERYELYRDSDEIGQTLTMVGYGLPGTGDSGVLTHYSGSPLRLKASNRFEADAATLKAGLSSTMAWTPTAGTQLVADFDDGSTDHDALGRLINLADTGLGLDEGMTSPGDSGGPAFIGNRIAGIASYIASLANGGTNPDPDGTVNSSFGELAFWQRVSHYQQWIDQSLRNQYPNAPTRPDEVQKAVLEGNSGTSYVYFLLQFTGTRTDPNQWLSVDYATRDGTAKAGEDYLAVHGKLVLYPGENQAVIPVEIVGDTVLEPDEYFYLDVFNPVGGSFGASVVTLTATRTIVNDDGVG